MIYVVSHAPDPSVVPDGARLPRAARSAPRSQDEVGDVVNAHPGAHTADGQSGLLSTVTGLPRSVVEDALPGVESAPDALAGLDECDAKERALGGRDVSGCENGAAKLDDVAGIG